MVHCDPKDQGVESFFPRSHVINSAEHLYAFQRDYLFTEAEIYMKMFLKSYLKQSKTKQDPSLIDDDNILVDYSPEIENINKEKLLICCKVTGTRLKDPKVKIDKKKGITADRITNGKIKPEEKSFLLRNAK